MLIERIKEIVERFNLAEAAQPSTIWNFVYGNHEWQNLGDYIDDGNLPFEYRKKYLLLLWKDRDPTFNEYGATTAQTFSGDMILSLRSKISDPSYEFKYEHHIKHLEALSLRLADAFGDCDGFTVTRWKESEVSDMYDTNMDGLKISFTITHSDND